MIDDFIEMDCPVCPHYYFEDDDDEEKAMPDYPGKEDETCRYCGWRYDLKQTQNPDLKEGLNEMSLNEYRQWYADKLKEDPDYDYGIATYVITPHICPVCSLYTFEDLDSFDICQYCGWEDCGLMEANPDDYEGCPNELTLNDYKKRYKKLLKLKPTYKYKDDMFLGLDK